MKRSAALVLVFALLIAGCAGVGPASGPRTRCAGSSAADDQRPLFFLMCVESP